MANKTDKEIDFRLWYLKHAIKHDLDSDPDSPEHHYDYRSAHRAGDEPDEGGHWPSRWKKDTHPNLVVDGMDTKRRKRVGGKE